MDELNNLPIKTTREIILDLLRQVKREGMSEFIEYIDKRTDYFSAPASVKYHSNYDSGLSEHSLKVYRLLVLKNKMYKREIPEESLIITALLHDFCKVNFYKKEEKWRKDERGKWVSYMGYGFREDYVRLGHGEKSVIEILKWIKLTDLEISMIRWHMLFTEPKDNQQDYSGALAMYPDIVILHTADVEAGVLYEKIYKEGETP